MRHVALFSFLYPLMRLSSTDKHKEKVLAHRGSAAMSQQAVQFQLLNDII